ncbi:hypothetical protein HDU96_006237 [Phlyctochytrium bullatum]|nr:hypothetical protein HDU96_006237 [Phlyctochytrium bullatum]
MQGDGGQDERGSPDFSDSNASELDTVDPTLSFRAAGGAFGKGKPNSRGQPRPGTNSTEDPSDARKNLSNPPPGGGHDRAASNASSIGSAGVGFSTGNAPGLLVASSGANSRRASVMSTTNSELGTFLTMGIDLGVEVPAPPPISLPARRASVFRTPSAGPTAPDPKATATAVYTPTDPYRLAKIESAVDQLLDEGPLSLSMEPPPIFGNYEIAQVIDLALAKVAAESNSGTTPEDIIMLFHRNASMDGDGPPKDEEGRKVFAQITSLQIKLKTSNAVLNEMGKRMEKLQRWVNDVSSKAAAYEQERIHYNTVIEGLKTQVKALEMRAETAEAAINSFDNIHALRKQALASQKDESNERWAMKANTQRNAAEKRHNARPIRVPSPSRLDGEGGEERTETAVADPAGERNKFVESKRDGPRDPKEITRDVILETARIIGVKKKFDPPTPLGVGLKSLIEREENQP